MSHTPTAALAGLTLCVALLHGCDVRTDEADRSSRGTGEGLDFASTGDRPPFASAPTLPFSAAPPGAAAPERTVPTTPVVPTTPAAPTDAVSPTDAGANAPSTADEFPEAEEEHWTVTVQGYPTRFTDSPFTGLWEPLRDWTPRHVYQIAEVTAFGSARLMYYDFVDRSTDPQGDRENCFELVGRRTLVPVGDALRQLGDETAEIDYLEWTVEGGRLEERWHYEPSLSDRDETLERIMPGVAANDLPFCDPPDGSGEGEGGPGT